MKQGRLQEDKRRKRILSTQKGNRSHVVNQTI